MSSTRARFIPRAMLLVVSLIAAAHAASPATQPSATDLAMSAAEARLALLQNVSVRFDFIYREHRSPNWQANLPPKVRAMVDPNTPLEEVNSYQDAFRFLNGRLVLVETLTNTNQDPAILQAKTLTTAIYPGRTERLHEYPLPATDPQHFGGVIDRPGQPFPMLWTLDLGLGLRLDKQQDWLTEEDLRKAQVVPDSPPGVVILRLISPDGPNPTGINSDLRFEEQYGYALTDYKATFGGVQFDEVTCDDFRRVGAVFMPFHMKRVMSFKRVGTPPLSPRDFDVRVSDYTLSDPANTKDSMVIVWPVHCEVTDARVSQYFDIGNVPMALSDDKIAELLKQRQAATQALHGRAQDLIDSVNGGSATSPPNKP